MFAIFLGQESSARQPSVSGSSDTDMSSATEESAQREATSAFGHDQSGNRHPRLVSIQSGYHASALSYLRTALKLYEDEQQVDCPAVSYVKQLLHIVRLVLPVTSTCSAYPDPLAWS